MHDDESARLLNEFRAGDATAAQRIFDRYAARLIPLARSRLAAAVRRRVDAEDVVQSAFRSFFARAGGEFVAVERPGDLWRLLARITIRKALRQNERHHRERRSVECEAALDFDDDHMAEAATREPSPHDAAELVEELRLLAKSLTPLQSRILDLHLSGESTESIALLVDRSARTVRRALEQIREGLTRRLAIPDVD